MAEPHLLTIGQLARRSGVPVRTIQVLVRRGACCPNDRTHSAATTAATTPRPSPGSTWCARCASSALGLDDVRLVLERNARSRTFAAAHRRGVSDTRSARCARQRAVCTLLARGPSSTRKRHPHGTTRQALRRRTPAADRTASSTPRSPAIDPDAPGAGIAEGMRRLPPELPDDPTTEQVEAWLELAELGSVTPAFSPGSAR